MTMFNVENRRSAQAVDLQPYGNTISVTALSDNPFEDAQDVEVFTQVSGGMAGPDPKMRSRAIMTQPPRERLHHAGKVRATQTVAPAHLQHRSFIPGLSGSAAAARMPARVVPNQMRRSFMPGLGADAPVMGPPAPSTSPWLDAGTSALTSAAQTYQAALAQKTADANARAASANAAAAAAQTERQRLLSAVIPNSGNMAAHAGISGTAMVIGAVAIGAAIFMFMKKRK